MSPCTGAPAERSLERYIQGTLPELEARSFEEHYFECPVCLAQVEALQAVTAQLAGEPMPLPIAPRRPAFAWPLPVGLGAVAALLIVSFFIVHAAPRPTPEATAVPTIVRPAPLATPTIASLADLSLPVFQPNHLRGAAGDVNFDAGMKAYAHHDCKSAIPALLQVAPHSQEALAARFYAGVCQMEQRSFDDAASTLRGVADAGDSPQQEAALYSLAQIDLARQDKAAAEQELKRTLSLHGDFERRARAQLDKLR